MSLENMIFYAAKLIIARVNIQVLSSFEITESQKLILQKFAESWRATYKKNNITEVCQNVSLYPLETTAKFEKHMVMITYHDKPIATAHEFDIYTKH